jgi:MFS family permease
MDRNIKLLALFNFFTDFKFYSAVLILYFAKITGSYALAMSLFSIIYLSAAIFEVPTGIYSDKIGRKNTIVLGAICGFLFTAFYAIGFNYWFLFIGAILEGLSRSFYSGNNDALLYDTLTSSGKKEEYSHYLGKINAMFQAALTVAVVIGSILANWSFSWVMWLTVIPQLCCLIISLFIIEPKRFSQKSANVFTHFSTALSLLWKNPKLRLLSVNQILGFGIGEAAFEFKSAFVASLWPIWAVGIPKMISYTGGGLSFWYSGKLIKKFGGINLMVFESFINRCINIFSLFIPTMASPLLMSSTSFLYGATEVASNSLMQKEFTDGERATLSSIASLGGSLFFGIFAIMIGLVADRTNPAGALLFAEFCSIPRIIVMIKLYRKEIYKSAYV